jgi:putative transposase
MKARIVYAAPEVNPGKEWKLDQLHLAYRSYVQDCINLLVKDKRGTINLSERRTYFPASEILSSQILKNAQMHAVQVVETWIKGVYGRTLKKVIRLREDLTDHQRMELRCCGKYLVKRAGKFGKGTITQEMVDLYWGWVWDSEVSGKPPEVSEDFPMMLTEMTCSFGPSEDAKHFEWWLQASCLTRNRTVKIPLAFNPYVKSVDDLAKGVLARKRGGRWTFQFCEKAEEVEFDGSQGKIAVDVGLNVIAATSDGRLYGEGFKPGFDKLYTKVRDLRSNRQRQEFKEDSKRLARLEVKLSGKIKTEVGRISNKLVKDFPGYTFIVEDLDLSGCRGQKRFAYRALQTNLEHKAAIERVNPAYSSQTCPSCDYVSRNNRKGTVFICRGCGRKSHADAVGGHNLLGRSEDKQVGMKTPLHRVKELLQRRFAERRRSPGVLLVETELEPSSRGLTVKGSPLGDIRTASNQVLAQV